MQVEEHSILEENGKKVRRRKKNLYISILQQMEFYFSDANLRKDRFIAKLVQTNPYIDLSVFLTFKKISALTSKVEEIATALEKSTILQLSEDRLQVCRTTPVVEKYNEDECTIYVERLPEDSQHDWLKEIFSSFGAIDYVSLPKYKHNKRHKGFAFIEFASPECAQKAITYFESIGCKLPTQMPPNQLVSIATFENEDGTPVNVKPEEEINNVDPKKENTEDIKEETDVKQEVKTESKKKKRKSQQHNEETIENQDELEIKSEPKKKKSKISVGDEKMEETKEEVNDKSDIKKKKRKLSSNDTESPVTTTGEAVTEEKSETKKKKRKVSEVGEQDDAEKTETKKKKSKLTDNEEGEITVKVAEKSEEEEEADAQTTDESKKKRKRKKSKKSSCDFKQLGLQVLSKREWKQLRNKYLNMQRIKMKSLKEHLYKNRRYDYPSENMVEEKLEPIDSEPRFKYAPGCIVEFIVPDTCTDVKKLKNDIKQQSGVEFVDVQPGKKLGFIRFSENKFTQSFLDSSSLTEVNMLQGETEKEYWEKITRDREAKLRKAPAKKVRGREKLLKKAEQELGKHIRFESI